MPKSTTQHNKELRQKRKDAGLVEYRVWVKPEVKKYLIKTVPLIVERWPESKALK